jgi:beta-lactamase class A
MLPVTIASGIACLIFAWVIGFATGYKACQRAWLASRAYEAAREAAKQ